MYVMSIKHWSPKEIFFTSTLHQDTVDEDNEQKAKRIATGMAKTWAEAEGKSLSDEISRIADGVKWKDYQHGLFVKTNQHTEYSIELRETKDATNDV